MAMICKRFANNPSNENVTIVTTAQNKLLKDACIDCFCFCATDTKGFYGIPMDWKSLDFKCYLECSHLKVELVYTLWHTFIIINIYLYIILKNILIYYKKVRLVYNSINLYIDNFLLYGIIKENCNFLLQSCIVFFENKLINWIK